MENKLVGKIRVVLMLVLQFCRKQKTRNETPLNGAVGGQEESLYEELDELQIMNSTYQ